ncbi:type II toxin-antitoxin system PemK/MazF family toxin [Actinomyces wuliandei]|uniref:type II toxin-antitoxin system PemK/MazF family toxin n=1 Tax=Actinomyces wuliandei TaxID=2057743 RepID=UPI000FD76025|nr:type II toxin-antitoxin system PemK/MazF family toxin [Actinomyces wuliandei]
MPSLLRRVLGLLGQAAAGASQDAGKAGDRTGGTSASGKTASSCGTGRPAGTSATGKPGEASRASRATASSSAAATPGSATVWDVARNGLPSFAYAPSPDGQADPGEVVWTWVPYEEDPSQGKDRPVLVLARSGRRLVVAQMTSRDHDVDAVQEARWGRYWYDVGSGAWDRKGRPSEVRLDRLLSVDPDTVRREGATMKRAVFEGVITALRQHWS